MSKNRENTAWPAADGTWSIGFYDYHQLRGGDDDDFDDEWDVDYDYSSFWWVSTGHPSADAAMDAYCRTNCNPGGGEVILDRTTSAAECEKLDAMVIAFRDRKQTDRYPW